MRRAAAVAMLALVAGACATPRARVETALVEAGIAPTRANCAAEILVDRLSVGQLRKLSELGELREKAGDDVSLGYYLEHSEALQDPEILAAVSIAVARC